MKIFLVSNMYPNKEYPNYGVFVKNTEEILKSEGWEIEKAVLFKSTNKMSKLFSYISHYLKILLKGLFGSYDVIYVHYAAHNALPLILLKKLKGNVSIYVNVHGSDVVPEVPSQEKFQPYVKKLLELSTKTITPSNYYKGLVTEKYGISSDKIFVFPSGGVNKKIFRKQENVAEIKDQMELDPKYRYIGFVGRLDVGKGWEIFLEAIRSAKKEGFMDGKKAIIVGNGSQREQYRQMVKEYGLDDDIVHYSLLPQEELSKIYNCLDLFCFPTTRKGESLGLVGLEAMACGVPVAGSKIGGLLDYIRDGRNGFLFDTGNSKELKDKIIKYFSLDEDKKEYMRKEAFSTAEEYEVENIKPNLIDIFSHKKERSYDN